MTTASTASAFLPLDPVGREEAREMARRELDKQIYQRDRPSWLERVWQSFSEWLQDLLSRSPGPETQGSGGGWVSIIVIVLVVALAIALVFWLMRGRRNPRSRRDALLDDEPSTALDHRDAAERHAAAGQWAEAIRERLRAMARDLEERAVLAARPGRTADELAAEAGEALPELAGDLRAAVLIFDDVWYGDRPGTAEGYARVKDVDERLRAARPKPLEDDDLTLAAAGEDGGPRW
ncbi:DUF4129 domain-containing protein [Actinomadura livida]|uniref:DUF4129 domain-containing protein n=1 Tax=Actinomadura livida TaxID=79909 RepID=A0A7W7I9I2_9ACTN|nr:MULTISPECIES: DUF4129 domain-containing protein [Actinomadura]MBB4773022.1 Flp pilus assembly protein TadB [Actinomadura catellatispora]GGU17518.1 hypothetical protein GCM10010208_48030 [Actinomadura livida]